MAFRLTYTPRFQKHFASLTAQEKKTGEPQTQPVC